MAQMVTRMHLNVTLCVHCPSSYTVVSPGAIIYSVKCANKYCCIARMVTLPEKKFLNVFRWCIIVKILHTKKQFVVGTV